MHHRNIYCKNMSKYIVEKWPKVGKVWEGSRKNSLVQAAGCRSALERFNRMGAMAKRPMVRKRTDHKHRAWYQMEASGNKTGKTGFVKHNCDNKRKLLKHYIDARFRFKMKKLHSAELPRHVLILWAKLERPATTGIWMAWHSLHFLKKQFMPVGCISQPTFYCHYFLNFEIISFPVSQPRYILTFEMS